MLYRDCHSGPLRHLKPCDRSRALILGPELKHAVLNDEHVEAHLVLTLRARRRRALVVLVKMVKIEIDRAPESILIDVPAFRTLHRNVFYRRSHVPEPAPTARYSVPHDRTPGSADCPRSVSLALIPRGHEGPFARVALSNQGDGVPEDEGRGGAMASTGGQTGRHQGAVQPHLFFRVLRLLDNLPPKHPRHCLNCPIQPSLSDRHHQNPQPPTQQAHHCQQEWRLLRN